MNIGILTYYGVHNHGAVLQANALKSFLVNRGHDVSFLTFERNYDFIPPKNAKKYKGGISSIPFYFKYVFEKGVPNITYNYKKSQILNKYRDRELPLGKKYDEFNGDLVIIGSDEVFSLEIGFNPCLYGIGVNVSNIISYGGCFGPTTIEDVKEKSLSEKITKGLSRFRAISVRDGNSQRVIKQLTNMESTLVCDPVILYGYEKEMCSFIPKEKDYIVLYAYDRSMQDKNEIEAIKTFAKKHNKKIYSVAYHHNWCDKNIQATPNELLGWIKNADCVITDTFHGTVLSIICNTSMIVKIRNNANKLKYLLKEYKLENRIINDFSSIDQVFSKTIDFEEVNSLISERRNLSMKFLNDELDNI
ncbi:MAG: polysaccharide pyruvyl transferase family protein [Lachnospiraceae bacterium]|nr:polysaccharide pyruvyl transferase family protein [Lachnospiraceae bacterium]